MQSDESYGVMDNETLCEMGYTLMRCDSSKRLEVHRRIRLILLFMVEACFC